MMLEEAIRECEFWTTNVPGTVAIGSTRKPEVGMYFNAPSIEAEGATDPHGPRIWGITVGRLYDGWDLIMEEIERRKHDRN